MQFIPRSPRPPESQDWRTWQQNDGLLVGWTDLLQPGRQRREGEDEEEKEGG